MEPDATPPDSNLLVVAHWDDEASAEAREFYRGGLNSGYPGAGGGPFPIDLLNHAFVGTVCVTKGADSLFHRDDGSPESATDIAVLAALIGLRQAVDLAGVEGPQKVNCPIDYWDLFVVDNPPNGVWVSTTGTRDKLRAPLHEWRAGLDSALEVVRGRLARELPELANDVVFGQWLRSGVIDDFPILLSMRGGL